MARRFRPSLPVSLVRSESDMVDSFIESARKLYDPFMLKSSMSDIFFTPEVSRLLSTFISRLCESENDIAMLRPEVGTP